MILDRRYHLIKEKMAHGYVKSFNDLFLFIPKTIVANDLGKKVERFNLMMADIGKFTLNDFQLIASFCNISLGEILKLAAVEFERQKKNPGKGG